jgi:DNA polymerase I
MKTVVIDIEADALENPKNIWVICCKVCETGELYAFREVTSNPEAFKAFHATVTGWIGHNILEYDLPIIRDLLGLDFNVGDCTDTLIVSRFVDYSRKSHSLASYGEEFNLPKGTFTDFSSYSKEMEDYCVRDVEIAHLIYDHYLPVILDDTQIPAIRLEHMFQLVCNDLHNNGFAFNISRASALLEKMEAEVKKLDEFKFPNIQKFVRKFCPKPTKFGTINQTSVPRDLRHQIHLYEVGKSYDYTKTEEFNPNSLKQVIDLMWAAGWKPIDKTKGSLRNKDVDKEDKFDKYGWKVNEINLGTLPTSAPPAAKTLAKRILYESRRRTLKEWIGLADHKNHRIHGKFIGIGAWTHRMSHQKPNMANIPNEKDLNGNVKLLGGEMRALFIAPKNRLLVGTDAKGIQLRIFAHYINDPEFTHAVTEGDPHSLNRSIMGSVCRTRAAAKRFIFAMLLGAGLGKLAEILECDRGKAGQALEAIMVRYEGFRLLKETIIPKDAQSGFFTGLDGRRVKIPGDSVSKRQHLAMSGYLQNGEAVVMKKATLKWLKELSTKEFRYYRSPYFQLVNLVHDEWQTECANNMDIALTIARCQHQALVEVGEELKLNCPLAGSYQNDNDYTIGTNWRVTH